MKKEDLLRAMGDVRDDFIEEAAPPEVSSAQAKEGGEDKERRSSAGKAYRWRRISAAAAALLVLVVGTGVFYRMQTNMKSEAPQTAEDIPDAAAHEAAEAAPEAAAAPEEDVEEAAAAAPPGTVREEVLEEAAAEEDADEVSDAMSIEEFAAGEENALSEERATSGSAPVPCGTLEEAEKTAGFALALPDAEAGAARSYAASPQGVIEVTDLGAGGEELLVIRKANGAAASDTEEAYEESSTVFLDGRSVTLLGAGGKVMLARWEKDEGSYTVRAGQEGMSREKMLDLVRNIN